METFGGSEYTGGVNVVNHYNQIKKLGWALNAQSIEFVANAVMLVGLVILIFSVWFESPTARGLSGTVVIILTAISVGKNLKEWYDLTQR